MPTTVFIQSTGLVNRLMDQISEGDRMTFIARAQICDSDMIYGRFRNPTPEELAVIDQYREKYLAAFGVYPAGSHWVDGVHSLVNLVRPGGIPD